VGVIPHTLKETTLGAVRVGARVNLEADVLARYVQRVLQVRESQQSSGQSGSRASSDALTEQLLREQGFV
jgi:riboflavin synthase